MRSVTAVMVYNNSICHHRDSDYIPSRISNTCIRQERLPPKGQFRSTKGTVLLYSSSKTWREAGDIKSVYIGSS